MKTRVLKFVLLIGIVLNANVTFAQPCNIEPIDFDSLKTEKKGIKFSTSFELIAKLDISFSQEATQKISNEVQVIEKNLQILVEHRNKCLITREQYLERLNSILDYEKSVIDFSDSIKKVDDNSNRIKILQHNYREREQLIISINKDMSVLEKKRNAISIRLEVLEKNMADFPENLRSQLKLDQDFGNFVRELTSRVMDETEKRIKSLETRVGKLEKSMSKIMALSDRGELRNTYWIYGVSGSTSYVDGNYYPSVYLNSEFILPNNKFPILSQVAPFVEIGYTFWEEEKTYPTLPGGPEVSYTEQNGYYYYGAGIRKYFAWRYSFSWFVGAHVGYTDEEEDEGISDWSYGVLGGLNYYPAESSIKVSAEFRYSKISLSEETRTFNPFGDAKTVRESNDYYLPTLMISFGKAY